MMSSFANFPHETDELYDENIISPDRPDRPDEWDDYDPEYEDDYDYDEDSEDE